MQGVPSLGSVLCVSVASGLTEPPLLPQSPTAPPSSPAGAQSLGLGLRAVGGPSEPSACRPLGTRGTAVPPDGAQQAGGVVRVKVSSSPLLAAGTGPRPPGRPSRTGRTLGEADGAVPTPRTAKHLSESTPRRPPRRAECSHGRVRKRRVDEAARAS